MEILYLLVPMSAVLVLLVLAVFGWALQRGQFEDLDGEAQRILQPETVFFDMAQGAVPAAAEESHSLASGQDEEALDGKREGGAASKNAGSGL